MLNWFKRDTMPLVGLDISSTSVKLLELSCEQGEYKVESLALEYLPPNTFVEKELRDGDALIQAVQKTIQQSGTQAKFVALAVPDSSVISKRLQFDLELDDYAIESQIAFEADKYIPYPIDEVSLDFARLGESSTQQEKQDVLLVACRTENVNAFSSEMNAVGLGISVVDVQSYAVARACQLLKFQLPNEGENQLVAVFDMGSTTSQLIVLKNFESIFVREESLGSDRLLDQISQHYGFSSEESLERFTQGTLPDDYEAVLLTPFKEGLSLQVERALQFFFSTGAYDQIDHVLLAGGNATLPGLVSLIQEKTGVSTSVVDPFEKMAFKKTIDKQWAKQIAPAFLTSCGLALRQFIAKGVV